MIIVFKEIEKKCKELEEIRIQAQTSEIMYRQKGEWHTADRFEKAEKALKEAMRILKVSFTD